MRAYQPVMALLLQCLKITILHKVMAHSIEGETKARILARLDKLTPETKGLWGKMNVAQMLAHLNDAFRVCLGMKEAKNKSNFIKRKIIFPIGVYVLPAFPKRLKTSWEFDQLRGGSKARDFYTELEFLKKMIDVFNEREESKLKPHPMFGLLSKKHWTNLFVKHLDHHLKQFGV